MTRAWWLAAALLLILGGGIVAFEFPDKAKQFLPWIKAAAAKWHVPLNLLVWQLDDESGFDPNAVSPVGAVGIAQFMPATAADLGIDPTDPEQAIDGQAHYMAQLYNAFGSWDKALAAYNWGWGNLQNAIATYGDAWRSHLPVETQNYLAKIGANVPGIIA